MNKEENLIYIGVWKELKEIGFKYNDLLKSYVLTYDTKDNTIKVNKITREIYLHLEGHSYTPKMPIVFYDLIQKGLVKKESEIND